MIDGSHIFERLKFIKVYEKFPHSDPFNDALCAAFTKALIDHDAHSLRVGGPLWRIGLCRQRLRC